MAAHHVKTVVISPGIIGCPHEEGVDYAVGEKCPAVHTGRTGIDGTDARFGSQGDDGEAGRRRESPRQWDCSPRVMGRAELPVSSPLRVRAAPTTRANSNGLVTYAKAPNARVCSARVASARA